MRRARVLVTLSNILFNYVCSLFQNWSSPQNKVKNKRFWGVPNQVIDVSATGTSMPLYRQSLNSYIVQTLSQPYGRGISRIKRLNVYLGELIVGVNTPFFLAWGKQ